MNNHSNALAPLALSRRGVWAGGEPIASALMARTIAQPNLISLAAGFVDPATLPLEPVRTAVEAVWRDPQRARAALQYGTTLGHLPLREHVLRRMLGADACLASEIKASVEQVIITAGSNELLYLVSDVLLDPGDIVITAAPSYYVYLGTLANLGARACGVEMDEYGMVPEAIDDRLRRLESIGELRRVKAVYVTTYSDNPTGRSLPLPRRAALLETVRRWSHKGKIYLIEDAAYRELRYRGNETASIRSLDRQGDTVIYAGTFSKSFSPGLRVGWGVLPKDLVGPVRAAKGNLNFGGPSFNQHVMTAALELGLYDRHVAQLRSAYREKLEATLAAAETHLRPLGGVQWLPPGGGLYLWLELPPQMDTGLSGPLFDRAVEEGMLYIPGECCYPREGAAARRNTLRLSFGIPTNDEIASGVAALARAVGRVCEGRETRC